MPPEEPRLEDTKAWLTKAAADIRAAEHDLTAAPPLLEDALFHAQQAAEKSLKAFLAWHDSPFRKTHNLEEIGRQCLELDPSLKDLVDRAAVLSEYAWKFRYPGEMDEAEPGEAEDGLATARALNRAVLVRVSEEAQS